MIVDAYHLPGLQPTDVLDWRTNEYGDGRLVLRFPLLPAAAVTQIVSRLIEARTRHLAALPTGDIVQIIDRAAARLADHAHPLRRAADYALPFVTGYSPAMLQLVLGRAIQDWRAPALEALLAAELPQPDALDRFVCLPGAPQSRAYGPRYAFHVFSGNVPGVAVTSLVRSLLVKAATLGKTAASEPLLPVLFARAIAEVSPDLGQCLAVTYWPGGSNLDREALASADTAIVYGGRDAISSIRARLEPRTRLVEHGPRVSFGLVGVEALADPDTASATAADAARATAIFDQQGCVSPHLLYVETGARVGPEEFAELVAHAMRRLAHELPRANLLPAEAAAIHNARASAEFRALAGEAVRLLASTDTAWTVIFDPRPDFEASCLNRVLLVKPIHRLEDSASLVAPFADLLQTVAIAGAGPRLPDLAARLGEAGVSRIASFANMPWPPPAWHHDGRGPLRELLRWV
ncbi:MAG: acyl-CoA reductase, partial [Candidatus Rokuibacteriota bacterium]